MHRALEIDEILRHIFLHFSPPPGFSTTCRAFKEPALDLLWCDLPNLSPLARCLPEAHQPSSSEHVYSFSRPLSQAEWSILQSYARRIRCITNFECGLDWASVATFLNPPATEPLFPNLRILRCECSTKTIQLLRLPLPSLTDLDVSLPEPYRIIESFPTFSPNMRKLSINRIDEKDTLDKIERGYISRWQNLSSVACSCFVLDVDDLIHLSRMLALTRLDFALCATFLPPPSHLVFANLRTLVLCSESLELVSRLLCKTQFPVITSFVSLFKDNPSSQDLTSVSTSVLTSNVGRTIEILWLTQLFYSSVNLLPLLATRAQFGFEEMQPWMTFRNLHRVELDTACDVNLTDYQILVLASAWPKLKILRLNDHFGWNSHGITPDGFVQLFKICRSLDAIALCLDTRGYTQVPASHDLASLGLTFPSGLVIDFVDSAISAESVAAVATFILGIAARSHDFSFCAWGTLPMRDFPGGNEYVERWNDVRHRVDALLIEPWDSRLLEV